MKYINVISFGSEEDKIGIGFEMFNTSGKREMSLEDFSKSYKDLMFNWSVLLGEKPIVDEAMIRSVFERIDRGGKGVIGKAE